MPRTKVEKKGGRITKKSTTRRSRVPPLKFYKLMQPCVKNLAVALKSRFVRGMIEARKEEILEKAKQLTDVNGKQMKLGRGVTNEDFYKDRAFVYIACVLLRIPLYLYELVPAGEETKTFAKILERYLNKYLEGRPEEDVAHVVSEAEKAFLTRCKADNASKKVTMDQLRKAMPAGSSGSQAQQIQSPLNIIRDISKASSTFRRKSARCQDGATGIEFSPDKLRDGAFEEPQAQSLPHSGEPRYKDPCPPAVPFGTVQSMANTFADQLQDMVTNLSSGVSDTFELDTGSDGSGLSAMMVV